MSLISALCLALLAVGSYGQIGSHSSQYTPYYVPLQGGGSAGYIRPNYYYGSGSTNYNQYRPDMGYGYGVSQQQQQQLGLGSQSYLPYSYVLNLQSDRVAGSQGQISTPLADLREQQIQPQLISPRYLARPPAYSADGNVQPLGATPNTLLLIPVSDSMSGYNYGGGFNNPYGSQSMYNPYGNMGYGLPGYQSTNNPYGNVGYGYRPIGAQQSSAGNVVKREEPAQTEDESARAETTDNNAKTE